MVELLERDESIEREKFQYIQVKNSLKKPKHVKKVKDTKESRESGNEDFKDLRRRIFQDFKNSSKYDEKKLLLAEYKAKSQKYLSESFSNNVVGFANKLIVDSKTLSQHHKSCYPVQHIVISIAKTLLMNELELTYLSIFLEKFSWESSGLSFEETILVTALCVKQLLNTDFQAVFNQVELKNPGISNIVNAWTAARQRSIEEITKSPKILNERFRALSRLINPFCKNNFIDYNFVVDQILQNNIPYAGKSEEVNLVGATYHPEEVNVSQSSSNPFESFFRNANQNQSKIASKSSSGFMTRIDSKETEESSISRVFEDMISHHAASNQKTFQSLIEDTKKKIAEPQVNTNSDSSKENRMVLDLDFDLTRKDFHDHYDLFTFQFDKNSERFCLPELPESAQSPGMSPLIKTSDGFDLFSSYFGTEISGQGSSNDNTKES